MAGSATMGAMDPEAARKERIARAQQPLRGDPILDTFHFGGPVEQSLYRAHRRRMTAWGLPIADGYEDDVVRRALRSLRGEESPPELHPHAHEEMGMCVECDAAAVLEAVADAR